MIVSIWKNLQCLSAGKKSTSSFMFSLRYCKDIVNWLFLVLIACLAVHTQSDTINFWVYLLAKNQLFPHVFMGILQRSNLFWVFWACLVTLTQNDGITSQKTLMFFCPNLSKNDFPNWANFPGKKGSQFFSIRIIYYCAKNQKNLMSHSWENCWMDTPKTSLFH